MTIVTNILFWLHLMALALGGAASFGIPVVGRQMASATPEMRPKLFEIMKGLSSVGRAGIGTLIVTGPLMVWLKYGGAGLTTWFWAKMVFVVLLLIGIIYSGTLLKRISSGDQAAAQQAPRIGMINTVLFTLVVLSAVFAFELT